MSAASGALGSPPPSLPDRIRRRRKAKAHRQKIARPTPAQIQGPRFGGGAAIDDSAVGSPGAAGAGGVGAMVGAVLAAGGTFPAASSAARNPATISSTVA